MENILVSACLVGINCKYNGKNNYNDKILLLSKKYNFILICPEYFGGLSIPRNPSEVLNDKVVSIDGKDVTKEYQLGALKALNLAKTYNCKKALLKEKSPSCGIDKIYDGTFTHTLINKSGITAQLLMDNDIEVYKESEIDELL